MNYVSLSYYITAFFGGATMVSALGLVFMPAAKRRSRILLALGGGIAILCLGAARIDWALYSVAVSIHPHTHAVAVVGFLFGLIAVAMLMIPVKFSGKHAVLMGSVLCTLLTFFLLALAPLFHWASNLQ